ncbi:MAG TPA: hypothetical protein VMW30_06380 [Candidatus Paceibacterota bacterium]|nr:hypothetical protein [Candidatus Paceibacterota bacterium]
MLIALKKTVPTAKFINTEWTPGIGTELAEVLNNSGIACSFGIQSASVGVTAAWVSDVKNLFDSLTPQTPKANIVEGMDSQRELIFRQVKNGFISGFGPIEVVGEVEKLKHPLDLTWNSTFIYVPSSDCAFS